MSRPNTTESPILFRGLHELLQGTENELLRSGFLETRVEEKFRIRKGLGRLSDNQLSGRCWEHPSAVIRSTYIKGPKIEIINVMGFPKDPSAVPVFASEIIHFAKAPRVAVIDIQPLWDSFQDWDSKNNLPLLTQLAKIRTHYSDLPSGGDLPGWCKDYFSPHCIYSRPTDFSKSTEIADAHMSYLKLWITEYALPNDTDRSNNPNREANVTSPAPDLTELKTYKMHHVEHSPGTTYLCKTFGEEWTMDYLSDFMYS